MDAGTTGAKGSTSKREPRDRGDRTLGVRRARVAQQIVMQGGVAIILLLMTWLSRGDRQAMALYLATIIVPAAWGYGFWSGLKREEAAREARQWTPEVQKREAKRGYTILGGSFALWIVIALLIVVLL